MQRLFAHRDVTLAVLRSLAPLERQIVLRLVLLTRADGDNDVDGISVRNTIERWTLNATPARLATDRLVRLGVCERLDASEQELIGGDGDGSERVRLSRSFADSLRQLLRGAASDANADNARATTSLDVERVERAKSYADVRWRSLVGLLVNVHVDGAPSVAASVVRLLTRSELARSGARDASLRITHRGFQFLLDVQASQLWTLILAHLSHDYVRYKICFMKVLSSFVFFFLSFFLSSSQLSILIVFDSVVCLDQ